LAGGEVRTTELITAYILNGNFEKGIDG